MIYRNNTGRLGFWLHQCVLRNTLAGSKTVVSISRNHPVHATTLHSHLLPAHTPAPCSHLYFGYKQPVPGVLLGFASAAAKDRATLHIPHTPWQSIQRSLGCTPLLPSPKSVRLWVVLALVGVSLASLFDPLFKRSRLHCFNIRLTWYLWHIKTWWQYLVPTYRVYTAPRYATIPKLTCWHVVSVLSDIWWSTPWYATIPILIWQHVLSVLLNRGALQAEGL